MTTMVKSEPFGPFARVLLPSLCTLARALRQSPLQRLARIVRTSGWAVVAVVPFWHGSAHAQTAPALLNMVDTFTADGVFKFDALETQAAAANDNAYLKVEKLCGIGGPGATPTCKGPTLTLFNRLRELEDNANELLANRGETAFSLHLDPQGISDALRWTAPEEYAAQGSMASKFVNSQASALSNRFSALRFASQGINVADGGSGGWNANGF